MDVRVQLQRVLRRVQMSAVELELQPECFQATEELRIASGELASILEEEQLDTVHAGASARSEGGLNV
jgi:hypothetical protein